jgi:hypothetical protein
MEVIALLPIVIGLIEERGPLQSTASDIRKKIESSTEVRKCDLDR